MKVKELIDRLMEMNPELLVYVPENSAQLGETEDVYIDKIPLDYRDFDNKTEVVVIDCGSDR